MEELKVPERIKVAVWSPSGSGVGYSGPGTYSFRMFAADGGRYFEPHLLHANVKQKRTGVYESELLVGDNRRTISNVNHLWIAFKMWRWIRRNADKFDVFFAFDAFSRCVLPAWWSERAGLPAVVLVTAHNCDLASKPGMRRILRLPERRRNLLHSVSGVIALSADIERELEGYGLRSNVVRINNFVDGAKFYPVSAEVSGAIRAKLGLGSSVISFVGSICARKAPHRIIEAALLNPNVPKDLTLLFVGPYDSNNPDYCLQFRRLVERARERCQVRHIEFTDDVVSYLQASAVFCLPSDSEGMPAALLEALACGIPAITTPISGCRDCVRDGINGFVVEPNLEDIAEKMEVLLSDVRLREEMSLNARRTVEELYLGEKTIYDYYSLFNRVKERGRGTKR